MGYCYKDDDDDDGSDGNISCPNCDSPNAELTTTEGGGTETNCPDCGYTAYDD